MLIIVVRSVVLLGAAALVFAGCERGRTGDSPRTPTQTAATSGAPALPPPGKDRFEFLLAAIPKLVNKVPCSCCPFTIGQCFRGGCPPTCGPCNQIGARVYEWHNQGMSDEAIVVQVKARYPRRTRRR